jgi:hypothetical protein
MAVRTQIMDPTLGIYTISYQDDLEMPTTNIAEGTTGNRYASNYMGARSRWWDLSWQQALLEREGITMHNRRIQQEIANLEDARSNILQGVPQRADSMSRSLMMGNTRRMEWNASSGDMTSTTVSTGGGGGSGRYGSGRIQPNAYVRSTVAALTQGLDDSPEQVARAMAQGRAAGQLWQDDAAQNQAAFAYIQNRIGQARTEMMNQGVSYDEAGQAAREYVETQWDSTDGPTKDLWNRFATIESQVSADQGGGRRVSTTTRDGREGLPEFYNQATGQLTNNVWEIDPFMYDQETMVDRIDREISQREGELQEAASPIDRARQIQRQEFGPSITQAWRGLGDRRRQREGISETEALIAQHLEQGGTWEEIQALYTGAPATPVGMAAPRAAPLAEQGMDMERQETEPVPEEVPVTSTQRHNDNILTATAGATIRLEKPQQLQRQVQNAEEGSPAAFARASMDNWRDLDPTTRPSINDMVDQTASQFNGVGDLKGRNEAVEYLLASFALETDSNLLG